jgi:hypothetical protein
LILGMGITWWKCILFVNGSRIREVVSITSLYENYSMDVACVLLFLKIWWCY